MLRFIIISFCTLGVLGSIFFLFVLRAQPVRVAGSTTRLALAPTPLSSVPAQSGVGPGRQPWMKNFEGGQLSSEFTASDFTPQKDGSFLVQNPKAIYYMNKGQFMLVTGDTGSMYCDSAGAAPSNTLFSGPTGTPRNGSLHHVRIQLFPSLSASKPTQVMETDNIHFDNDTYRMYTESYTDDQGHAVAADQVPVAIRGDQYEFDGKGLTIVVNGINHRLERLEVAHGRRLEIKDTAKLALPGMAAPETQKRVVIATPWTDALVSTDPYALRLIATPKPTPRVEPPTPYRAVFHDDVQITEPDRTMATADVMTVDFLQGSSSAKAADAPPVAVPVTEPPAAIVVATQPVQTTEIPATKPAATKPVNGPITIYWTGKLLVTPIQGEPILPLTPGQSIVKLVGSPVKLTPEGSQVQAATVVYRNPDGAVRLSASQTFPVIHLTQSKGLALDTGGVVYDPATAIATLNGPNELQVPLTQKQMKVTWIGTGLLHIIRVPTQPNGVDHVDLAGDVAVTHPTFVLNSNRLVLDLDLLPKPGAKPTDGDEQLKLLTATEDVHCRLIHPGKPTQGIDSDKLVIRTERTADKRTVPREVIADGSVHAFDPDQSITAGHLDALLLARATTKPTDADMGGAVDLESLDAQNSVHALLKSGATSDSEKLRVTTVNGKQLVELSGPTGAKLNNQKGSWLQGPLVQITPDQSGLKVFGPGRLQTIHTSSTTRPGNAAAPRPIDVTWSDSLSLDGAANIADVHGHVFVKNTDAVGTVSNISGDNAHIDLMDAPRATTKSATTQPDALGSAMGGKQVKMLTLTGNVVGDSELRAADGTLARQSTLHGNQLIYNAVNATAIVPGAGWMLVENHRPDAAQGANNRGRLAVAWKQQLTYNQTTQKINIDGDTVVGFERDEVEKATAKPPALPMQLRSQHLVITLVKAPNAKDGQGKLQLSQMQANGQVRFNAQGADFESDQVDYDPKSAILIATGHGRTLSADQTVTGSFSRLVYDTVKEEVAHVEGSQVKVQR